MDRRSFLKTSAALALAPAFIRRAFGDQSIDLPGLGTGLKRAQVAKRQLLVFVIPEDDQEKWDRGYAFGEWLNHGATAQVGPLALFEVVCARMSQVRGMAPEVGHGEPLMVAIDPRQNPPKAVRLDAKLPPHEGAFLKAGETLVERQRADERVSHARTAVLARLVRGQMPPVAGFDEDAAAAEVKARLVYKRIPGSKWAHGGGCGSVIEDEPHQLMPACGAGHVPKKSSRFLYWYAAR